VLESVTVFSSDGVQVETVHPAVARIAIRSGAAHILDTAPFAIQLETGYKTCPKPKSIGESVRGKMSESREFIDQLNEADLYMRVVDFFNRVDADDKLVWVKAVAPGGMQVALDIRGPDGKTAYKVPAIQPGKPVCLSKYGIPFDILKSSLTREATAQPPTLRLLTTGDVRKIYAGRAAILKTDVDTLMKQDAASQRIPKKLERHEVDQSAKLTDEREQQLSFAVTLTPHIEHLLGQVDPRLDADDRMSVQDFMREVLTLEEELTLDDLEAISSKGFYPTAIDWAKKQFVARMQADGRLPTSDALSD
jgi:hypothetical protein